MSSGILLNPYFLTTSSNSLVAFGISLVKKSDFWILSASSLAAFVNFLILETKNLHGLLIAFAT